jgi:acyl-coenzyme A thioesterase PaaI-like protein
VSPGRVSTQLPLTVRHKQHTGQAHAGVMATLVMKASATMAIVPASD